MQNSNTYRQYANDCRRIAETMSAKDKAIMLEMAKVYGMKTMLGCMISSSVSVTAAAHLSPLVDYADLDGNLLISNDPFTGVTVREGKLMLPDRPGLGLKANA